MNRKTHKWAIAATDGNVVSDLSVSTLAPNSGKPWKLAYGHIKLTTDATVANRIVRLRVLDESGNVVLCLCAGVVVTASHTDQMHTYMQGIYRETAFANSAVQVPIASDLILMPGWTLRALIENGVAGDSYSGVFVLGENDPS